MGFEPMMRVLQTLALPLGDVAVKNRLLCPASKKCWIHLPISGLYEPTSSESSGTRAGDGIRTHDLLLGKETYYRCTTPASFFGHFAE
jgi:hypothetical protein